MRFCTCKILLAEVPDEISLGFEISGCAVGCKMCHSVHLHDANNGNELTDAVFNNFIQKYLSSITCVVFLGGEWHKEDIIKKLKIARGYRLKTCLYTGRTDISDDIKQNLDFLKTGPYIQDLGGLNSPKTNQIFKNLKTSEVLNYKFL